MDRPKRFLTKKAREYHSLRYFIKSSLEHGLNMPDYGALTERSRYREDLQAESHDNARYYGLHILTSAILHISESKEDARSFIMVLFEFDPYKNPIYYLKKQIEDMSIEEREDFVNSLKII